MCDTRTWVFKLLIVFLIVHSSRIQQWHVAGALSDADADINADVDVVDGGKDIAYNTAAVYIDDDDNDDSLETTSSPEDTLSESQRSILNSTKTSSKRKKSSSNTNSKRDDTQWSSESLSFSGRIANRLASEDGIVDGDEASDADADSDKSNEEFNEKFNNAAETENNQQNGEQRKVAAESKTELVFGIMKRAEDDRDYAEDTAPTMSPPHQLSPLPPSTSSSSSSSTAPTSIPWNGNTDQNENENQNDDDVDEILQPMLMVPSDKRWYNSNNEGRESSPEMGYSTKHHSTAIGKSSGSAIGIEESSSSLATNRMKPGYPSAFEQHKAYIRNNRRYGHKSHKKKYKDYLRYHPLTATKSPLKTTTTTTISSLRKSILARDRIYNSDDIPRSYYQGHVNYYMNTDEYDTYHDADKKDQIPPPSLRSYHSSSYPRHHQHHNSGHLRNGGRYNHISLPRKKPRPYVPNYPDYNMMNYHHLGARAKQQHQKELEKKIDEYSQYYSKWPHLTQVEDQVFEDEQTDILYPEGDIASSSNGELVLAAEDDEGVATEKDEEDKNLPPYIKKYRRRNKQLLEMLEGTQPPSTPPPQWSSSILKPGPIEGSNQNTSPRHRLHQHRQHHHHRQHRNRQRSHRHKNSKWPIEDLFEEQRANPNNPNKTITYPDNPKPTQTSSTLSSTSTVSTSTTSSIITPSPFNELLDYEKEHLMLTQENQLPAEDLSISRELYDWAIEIGKDHPASRADMDEDDYNGHRHSGLYSWKVNPNANSIPKQLTTTTVRPVASVRRPNVYGSIKKSPPANLLLTTSTAKPINTFVYHRVVEAPRVVGAGQTGRKQRLPFVAITDRRLETSRKGMGNAGPLAHKDFEQNHFPMP